jgi:GrpB-like predicted nucleotidyltransferase (UPF0157 family)
VLAGLLEAILANPVVIADYDPSWPFVFAQLRGRLAATLSPFAVAIEHVGSTAVPGLAAKPIIDLDVVIADRADLPAVLQRLHPLGYRHEGDLGVPGREAFTTPAGAPPHHLYVCAIRTAALDRHLAFRDALRADAAAADAYSDLKRTLAARLGHDRIAYTEAKSAFVERVLAQAAAASGGTASGPRASNSDRSATHNDRSAGESSGPATPWTPGAGGAESWSGGMST